MITSCSPETPPLKVVLAIPSPFVVTVPLGFNVAVVPDTVIVIGRLGKGLP